MKGKKKAYTIMMILLFFSHSWKDFVESELFKAIYKKTEPDTITGIQA